ncbi:MAG: lysosomal Pro-X carboxypeptidase [Sylvanvirus sp.]|uniref:Lysosomal Pro-X carboxypeptidase n=1 Tax=Sylvanvirus sp. TaxID=2487774 RepID=A0A3G5AGW1_9VIRU|nr:MAG: lysosomal Pro-X carboxypeptidase [Sylvanvirus sp.]
MSTHYKPMSNCSFPFIPCVQDNAEIALSRSNHVPLSARYTISSILGTTSSIQIPDLKPSYNLLVESLTTDEAIRKYANKNTSHDYSNVCALNFANAIRCGGSYLDGLPGSQEEELMRCIPSLYTTLNRVKYPFDNEKELLWTPPVQVQKIKTTLNTYNLEEKGPWTWIITAAAPDLRIPDISFNQTQHIKLLTAILVLPQLSPWSQDIDTLILGAFGNGVFLNDPVITSTMFSRLLPMCVGTHIKRIVFAIPGGMENENFKTYQKYLTSSI